MKKYWIGGETHLLSAPLHSTNNSSDATKDVVFAPSQLTLLT